MQVSSTRLGSTPAQVDSTGSGPRPPWAALLIALSPLSVIVLLYLVAQWVSATIATDPMRPGATNRSGFSLHVTGPPSVDLRLFGAVPTVWLQQRLVDGSPHWYDVVATGVYLTHYLVLPVVTGLVWFRFRDRFRTWIGAALAVGVIGISTYVIYPAAPPWLAAPSEVIAPVRRVSALGWDALHLDGLARLFGASQSASNPVAAMPSLHAAVPVLVALFLWPVAARLWRSVMLSYAGLMSLVLVYSEEHYVVDVVAGWATAGLAVLLARVFQRAAAAAEERVKEQT